MPRCLLDTHILFRWREDSPKLSKPQLRELTEAERQGQSIAISAITLCELAAMVARGRVEIDGTLEQWLHEIECDPGIEVLPITAEVAMRTVGFSTAFPGDPADRIIAATALCHGLRLVTSDERIRNSGAVPVV